MTTFWSVISQVGFWGWVLAAVGFILSVFPRRGVFLKAKALGWGLPLLVFYVVWVVGMLNV